MAIIGAVEAGGTKFLCAVGTSPDNILHLARFPTLTPENTLPEIVNFFRENGPIDALGIGSFGPLDLAPLSPTYGYITKTPKAGWQNIDLVGYFIQQLKVPVKLDTDVNAAAIGEHTLGAGKGMKHLVYLTVGTGIGGGVLVNGTPLHGMLHPEIGHMYIPQHPNDTGFSGNCPFHKKCLEGLASGPAIEQRWGRRGEDLNKEHPAWQLEAYYLGLAIVNLILVLAPQKIILGGGVMQQKHLFPMIIEEVKLLLNQYIQTPFITQSLDTYIVPPLLGDKSGICGAFVLAQHALEDKKQIKA